MASSIYQNGIHTVQRCDYYQHLCRREKYMHLHVYISEWIYTVQRCDYYQQLVPQGENTPRDMAFLCIYQNDLHGAATTTRRNIHPDMAFHVYQNGIYTVQAAYHQQ
jgi:hypothetical protein